MQKHHSILIVDDDEDFRFTLSEILRKDGYGTFSAKDAFEAFEWIKKKDFSLIIMDIKMPKKDGLEAISEILRINPKLLIIVLTAYGTESVSLDVIGQSAFAYFTKPFDIENLRSTVRKAIEKSESSEEVEDTFFKEIIGDSSLMMEVKGLITKIASTDITVLIQGESGTGKELVAKAIHYLSPRKDKRLVPVTCSAIPETLLESELFGYEKGAFTDAQSLKIGKIELANQGTLFLDEIGDMSLSLQAKLLRVLEEKEIERLGGTRSIKVDVRVIAATNKDLYKRVKEGQFREDLFYRLNIISLNLPPLRKRKEDIPALVEHFIKMFNKELNREIKGISVDALELLTNYLWPGNIRELKNFLQQAMVLEQEEILTKSSFSFLEYSPEIEKGISLEGLGNSISLDETLKEATKKVEKQVILQALTRSNMNRELAAKELGISRKTLYNKMKEYGIYG